uniref:Uncharacterized protein n=1 Tax=Siphoviridae sp. ct7EW56 TaxID=2827562 RepID=A0A8S5LS39_9CAUD|nr:MAG TPA: hypothetical protein [Siphoviridae sp. ct7EW56]
MQSYRTTSVSSLPRRNPLTHNFANPYAYYRTHVLLCQYLRGECNKYRAIAINYRPDQNIEGDSGVPIGNIFIIALCH